jgi:cytochrome P450
VSHAVLAIIAGSDTSATVLSNIFFFLLTHPESYERLQVELDKAIPTGGKEPTNAALLSRLPYLNAVMYVRLEYRIILRHNIREQQRISSIVAAVDDFNAARTDPWWRQQSASGRVRLSGCDISVLIKLPQVYHLRRNLRPSPAIRHASGSPILFPGP